MYQFKIVMSMAFLVTEIKNRKQHRHINNLIY